MRKTLSKSVLVMAAASGILTASGGYAFADASADGAAVGSPGVGSGNAVQVPVHVPVNLCGNTVNVIGLLNPAFGNECENADDGSDTGDAQGASANGVAANSPGVLSGNLIQAPVDVPVNVCGNTVDVIGALNPAFGNECENGEGGNETPKPPTQTEPPTHHQPPTHHEPPQPPKTGHHHHHNGDCPPGHHHNPPTHKPPHHNPPTHKPPHHNPPTHKPPHHNPPTHTWHHHKPTHHHKPWQMAHTGANSNLGIAGGASAAMILGGGLLMRRTRNSQS
ncbi:chaplin family protein [Streptomyces laculatispora]|uniref:Chaplin family protein n=1 Tax=Streptomyces laculatispora TaxID=887464 RepID=A0ABY9HYX9_9ACTN|nr:chaplin family protein [Streptomyces laculatispora]WLQ39797.1 chaplin family protein [Streptomyces laculatispora]